MDSHVRVPAHGNGTTIDYPPWKARRVDKTFLGQSSTVNPMPSAFEGVLGSEVRGERGVHGVFDDNQDNAANSCAIVVLVNETGESIPAYTPVMWRTSTNIISARASVRPIDEDEKSGRMMSVVNELAGDGTHMHGSVTMHPLVYHGTMSFGITQADVAKGGSIAVGIQHYSQICIHPPEDSLKTKAGGVLEMYDGGAHRSVGASAPGLSDQASSTSYSGHDYRRSSARHSPAAAAQLERGETPQYSGLVAPSFFSAGASIAAAEAAAAAQLEAVEANISPSKREMRRKWAHADDQAGGHAHKLRGDGEHFAI